jgi:16S rRNA (guanine(1405)-N(7))-methyltransferase
MLQPKLDLEALVAEVTKGPKYALIDPLLVRKIATEEATRQPKIALAVKSTRTRLHQLVGAYYDKPSTYAQMHVLLKSLLDFSPESLKTFALQAMPLHASTAERLPFVADFYRVSLQKLGPIRSVLDLGCGLNPLAIPFLPLAEGFTYEATDVLLPLLDFLNAYFGKVGIQGKASVLDLSSQIPQQEVDLVIMLKLIPLLDQIDKGIASILLQGLKAKAMLISFPLKSLGGRGKGMLTTYQKRFEALSTGLNAKIDEYLFPNELVYLIRKGFLQND